MSFQLGMPETLHLFLLFFFALIFGSFWLLQKYSVNLVSPPSCSVLWDLERGVKMTTYEAHEGDVISLSLHPDKTSFVTGSVDNTARVRTYPFMWPPEKLRKGEKHSLTKLY